MTAEQVDVLIIGAGVAGLNCALHLPRDCRVLILCKGDEEESDSFLAQGGMCVLRDKKDFRSYFEDTMRAGHYENNPATVRCMIENSRAEAEELLSLGVRFERDEKGNLAYTREGAHSRPRILFHADCTGKEITSKLLAAVRSLPNAELRPQTTMIDLLCEGNACFGAVLRENATGKIYAVYASHTVLATGGVGGLFRHSTNYPILTGDGLAVSYEHGVAVEHPDYVQIHPTTLYTEEGGRSFLISESVRGEGAVLLDRKGERFVDELLPRDVVTAAIRKKMKEEGSSFVRLDLSTVRGGLDTLRKHFPGILQRLTQEGYDPMKEPVPVVPAQHYFMGGIKSDLFGRTSMARLYAVGETCCNGVHGKNRLASNSLLESLIFSRRAAEDIVKSGVKQDHITAQIAVETEKYADCKALFARYRARVGREVNCENE